jgi:hypothetical protein
MFTRLMQRPQLRTSAYRPFLEPVEDRCLMAGNVVLDWNQAALAATIEAMNPPLLAARNVAIVHAAVYDAVNSIDRTFQPYFVDTTAPRVDRLIDASLQWHEWTGFQDLRPHKGANSA